METEKEVNAFRICKKGNIILKEDFSIKMCTNIGKIKAF